MMTTYDALAARHCQLPIIWSVSKLIGCRSYQSTNQRRGHHLFYLAGMAKLADATDLSSVGDYTVRVRLSLPALMNKTRKGSKIMKYKILIKYADAKLKNLWEVYGSTTVAGSTVTFTEFETDDVNELQNTITELDKQIGHENIRVISDVTYNVGVTVDIAKADNDVTDNNE